MAEVLRTYHVIAVTDLERSGKYYADVLGFKVEELGDPGWRLFVKGGCRIMAGECTDLMPAKDTGDHSYFAYLVVEGIDSYYEQIRAAGGEFVKQLRDEPWGMREFGVRTIDGHRIMVGQHTDDH